MEEVKTAMAPPPSRKRPLESTVHSNYFNLRAVIRDLRPRFLQVLRTPDFKNCKASQEIREQMKTVIKLYDNMKADAVSLAKSKNVQDGQMKAGQLQRVKSPEQSQVEKSSARPSEIKLTPPVPGFQKQVVEDGQTQGTYVVGGSAFGWNFITFSGKESVYYGRTKEQFRSGKVTE
ncbi:uncharacterized protein LOC109801828 [Cajanus cajan]|uniref:Uncharacterized protein n=1 Tax=Cajanus cajan TaxID=3821 RepID=A0A151TBK4_CAJCA|nr:uncharacterized protein LOC109801828 [Cajanus cajan]KYP64432.1 hypothetical protein KK1_019028 [Cajanus cajan]